MKKILIPLALLVALCVSQPAMASSLRVGDTAPDFTAESTAGTLSLAEYLGKKNVVLALYFRIATPV